MPRIEALENHFTEMAFTRRIVQVVATDFILASLFRDWVTEFVLQSLLYFTLQTSKSVTESRILLDSNNLQRFQVESFFQKNFPFLIHRTIFATSGFLLAPAFSLFVRSSYFSATFGLI